MLIDNPIPSFSWLGFVAPFSPSVEIPSHVCLIVCVLRVVLKLFDWVVINVAERHRKSVIIRIFCSDFHSDMTNCNKLFSRNT